MQSGINQLALVPDARLSGSLLLIRDISPYRQHSKFKSALICQQLILQIKVKQIIEKINSNKLLKVLKLRLCFFISVLLKFISGRIVKRVAFIKDIFSVYFMVFASLNVIGLKCKINVLKLFVYLSSRK